MTHNQSNLWELLEKNMNDFENSHIPDERKALAKNLISQAEVLQKSFFMSFVSLGKKYDEQRSKFFKTIDKHGPIISEVVQSYFITFYKKTKKHEPNITFLGKQAGSRLGTIARIECDNESTVFYVKTNHDAGSSSTSSYARQPPDLRELLMYKLLEHAKIGPCVHFPSNNLTVFIVLIATKEVKELKLLSQFEANPTSDLPTEVVEAVAQAYLLTCIFGLADLHGDNFGLDERNNLSIVDFYIGKPRSHNCADAYLNNTDFGARMETRSIILETLNRNKREQIATAAMARWNLSECIKQALEEIDPTKQQFKNRGTKFQNATVDLHRYVETLNRNIEHFVYATSSTS